MTMQPDLITVPETPCPPLEAARRNLAALENAPPCYLKFDVERTSRSEIYVRVLPGTLPKDVPNAIINAACHKIDSSDWGYGASDHEYSGYNGRLVEADEAECYSSEDATGIDALRAEVIRMEQEATNQTRP